MLYEKESSLNPFAYLIFFLFLSELIIEGKNLNIKRKKKNVESGR